MTFTRRSFLQGAGSSAVISIAIAAGVMRPVSAQTSGRNARLMQIMQSLRAASPVQSDAVLLKAPAIAVDGTSVFIDIASTLPDVDAMMVLVDRNPQPLVAAFHLAPEVIPELQFRIKVAQTAQVIVVAHSAGQFYRTAKTVKVTVGGCGSGLN